MHPEEVMVKINLLLFPIQIFIPQLGRNRREQCFKPILGPRSKHRKVKVCVFGREGGGGMFSLAKSHLKIKVCQDPSVPVGGTSV